MLINYATINEIIENTDILSVIKKYVGVVKKSGQGYVCNCPFHSDTHASLSISPKKRIWKCWPCNVGGNVIKFVEKINKCSIIDAIKILQNEFGVKVSNSESLYKNSKYDASIAYMYEILDASCNYYMGFLKDPRNKDKLKYITDRGLDQETIDYFKIGYCPKENIVYNLLTNKGDYITSDDNSMKFYTQRQIEETGLVTPLDDGKPYNFFNDRIMFPICDQDGSVVGFSGRTVCDASPKYLNSMETRIFKKNTILFNYHNVLKLDTKKVIIVEGFMDAIAFHQAGYSNVIATMGVSLSPTHIKMLKALSCETIILAFDNDNAGTNANINIGKNLIDEGFCVWMIGSYDKQYKDVDELFRKCGKNKIDDIINNVRTYISFKIESEFIDKVIPKDEINAKINSLLRLIIDSGELINYKEYLTLLSQLTQKDYDGLELQLKNLCGSTKGLSGNDEYELKTMQPTIKKDPFENDKRCIFNLVKEIISHVYSNKSDYDEFLKMNFSSLTTFGLTNLYGICIKIMENIRNNEPISNGLEHDPLFTKIWELQSRTSISKLYNDFNFYKLHLQIKIYQIQGKDCRELIEELSNWKRI